MQSDEDRVTSSPVHRSFDDAFSAITSIVKADRVIFVMDEFPYLCDADASIPSVSSICWTMIGRIPGSF